MELLFIFFLLPEKNAAGKARKRMTFAIVFEQLCTLLIHLLYFLYKLYLIFLFFYIENFLLELYANFTIIFSLHFYKYI